MSARLLNRFSTAEPDEAVAAGRGALATFGAVFFTTRTFLTTGGFGGVTTGVTADAVFAVFAAGIDVTGVVG